MVVDVKTSSSAFEASTPRELFNTGYLDFGPFPYHPYVVSGDGQRFLIPRPATLGGETGFRPIAVVLNWPQGIQH